MTNNHIEITNQVTNQVFDIDVLNYRSVQDNCMAFDLNAAAPYLEGLSEEEPEEAEEEAS